MVSDALPFCSPALGGLTKGVLNLGFEIKLKQPNRVAA